MNRWDNDTEFEKHQIGTVSGKPGQYIIHFVNGFALCCPSDFEPRPGDEAILFGRGLGYIVRGLIVGGREVWYNSPEEQAAKDNAASEEYERKQALIPKCPPVTSFGRTFSGEMREISGFGGGYETCCRAMVLAGVEWLSKNPEKQPSIGGFVGIIGIHTNENEDAKELEKAMTSAVYEWDGVKRVACEDCSGAMVEACMKHTIFAHRKGWDVYVKEMTKEERQVVPVAQKSMSQQREHNRHLGTQEPEPRNGPTVG